MSEIFPKISANITNENSGIESGIDSNRPSGGFDSEKHAINESISSIVTSFAVYKLLTDITKPFTSFGVYSSGAIDADGNILDPRSNLLTPYMRLVIGIKRLVRNLGNNKMRAEMRYLQTAAQVMAFECAQMGGNEKLFLEELEKAINFLTEEGEGAASIGNSIGGGFSNPQVGENPNPALAGFSPPLGMVKRKKKNKKDEIQ